MSSSAELVVEPGAVPLDAVSTILAGAQIQGDDFVEEQDSHQIAPQGLTPRILV